MDNRPTIPWKDRTKADSESRKQLWIRPPGGKLPDEVAEDMIEWVGNGHTLSSFAKKHGVGYTTVWRWLKAEPELAAKVKSAREEGMDAIAEECLTIIDQMPEMSGNRGRDAAYVQWMRARVETRLRILAIWDPARFSIKYQHKHDGDMSLQVLTGVPRKAAEAAVEGSEGDEAPRTALPSLEDSEAVEAEFEVVERSNPYGEEED